MPQPPPYDRATNFVPLAVPPMADAGARLNAELEALELTLRAVRVNLALIQRDDGALANESVTAEALAPQARVLLGAGWRPFGAWAAGAQYPAGGVVSQSATTFVAVAAHTAAPSFATDLAAGRWLSLTTAGAEDITNAIAAANAATAAANAAVAPSAASAVEARVSADAAFSSARAGALAAITAGNYTAAFVEAMSPVPTATWEAFVALGAPLNMGDWAPGSAPYAIENYPLVRLDLARSAGSTTNLGDYA